jgi:hypothetical protein
MICPNCNSTDLKKLSLIYEAGTYESHGRLHGLFLGSIGGLWAGRYRGTNQSSLSKMVAPPMKLPYASPTILWVVAFFILMAPVGRGKLSMLMASFLWPTSSQFLPISLARCSTISSLVGGITRSGKHNSSVSVAEPFWKRQDRLAATPKCR